MAKSEHKRHFVLSGLMYSKFSHLGMQVLLNKYPVVQLRQYVAKIAQVRQGG